jgi:hypothetical protein
LVRRWRIHTRSGRARVVEGGGQSARASAECIAQPCDIGKVMGDVVEGVAEHPLDVHLVAPMITAGSQRSSSRAVSAATSAFTS